MSSKRPRLRGHSRAPEIPYPLGEFPDDVVRAIGKQVVYRLVVGQADFTGDDFGTIFANSISAVHYQRPVGVTDVVWNGCSWSVKTVKAQKPFETPTVRLITGRNSPAYSYGITDPMADVARTGEAVLNVWNQRVNDSHNDYDELRIVVLIRNIDKLEFTLFECEAARYVPADYEWKVGARGNLHGHEKATGKHCFTWQLHGSQFTVIRLVPGSAYKFRIKKNPGQLEMQHVLTLVKFEESWIERVP